MSCHAIKNNHKAAFMKYLMRSTNLLNVNHRNIYNNDDYRDSFWNQLIYVLYIFYSSTEAVARWGTCSWESTWWDRSQEAQRTRGEEKGSGEKTDARNTAEDERKKRKCHPGIVGYRTRLPLWSPVMHWILPQSVSWEGKIFYYFFIK